MSEDPIPFSCVENDPTFGQEALNWFAHMMPEIPLYLLDTENIDRWEVELPNHIKVREKTWQNLYCPVCDDLSYRTGKDLAARRQDDDVCAREHQSQWEITPEAIYVLWNEDTSSYVEEGDDYARDSVAAAHKTPDGTLGFDTLRRAEAEAIDVNRSYAESIGESSYMDWVCRVVYLPNDEVTDDDLDAAGFSRASYQSGNIRYGRSGNYYRVAGLNYAGTRYVTAKLRLAVAWHDAREIALPTVKGMRLITLDERSDLQRLAQDTEDILVP